MAAFRYECVRRRTLFDLQKKKDKLHLLKGLGTILLDIDKAIRIIRETDEEAEVVPNLMIGFGIDEIQADYVAEIKLRYLNKEYILKRLQETDDLEKPLQKWKKSCGIKNGFTKSLLKNWNRSPKNSASPAKHF